MDLATGHGDTLDASYSWDNDSIGECSQHIPVKLPAHLHAYYTPSLPPSIPPVPQRWLPIPAHLSAIPSLPPPTPRAPSAGSPSQPIYLLSPPPSPWAPQLPTVLLNQSQLCARQSAAPSVSPSLTLCMYQLYFICLLMLHSLKLLIFASMFSRKKVFIPLCLCSCT